MSLTIPTLDAPMSLFADDMRPAIPLCWYRWAPCADCPGGFRKQLRDLSTPFAFTLDFIIERTNAVVYHKSTGISGYNSDTWPNLVVEFAPNELLNQSALRGLFLCRLRATNLLDDSPESTTFHVIVKRPATGP